MNRILITLLLMSFGVVQAQIDIFDACRTGDIPRIEELYKLQPESINSINKNGHTPLILACYRNQVLAVKKLLELGAEIDYQSGDGTALLGATYQNNYDVIKLLLDDGANPNISDANKETPLIMASKSDNAKVIKLLLEAGADKNIKDKLGNTAANYAKITRNEEIIQLLKD